MVEFTAYYDKDLPAVNVVGVLDTETGKMADGTLPRVTCAHTGESMLYTERGLQDWARNLIKMTQRQKKS